MKIAYLILCHKNPIQVSQMIAQLNDGNCDFFIHIDKKCELFDLPDDAHIILCPENKRVDVKWATVSMIYATLNLIKLMLRQKQKYDYVILLSGQDYPIKNNEYIQNLLQEKNGNNFIEIISHDNPLYLRYLKRSILYYPEFMMNRSFLSKCIRHLYIKLSGGYSKTLSLFKRKNDCYQFEFGSQWWCLTLDCLKWMMNYLRNHPEYLKYFNHTTTPDECFFQTLFKMSPYFHTAKPKLMFFEWADNKNSPRILTINDIDMIINNDKELFARKFDIKVDTKILEELQHSLNLHS